MPQPISQPKYNFSNLRSDNVHPHHYRLSAKHGITFASSLAMVGALDVAVVVIALEAEPGPPTTITGAFLLDPVPSSSTTFWVRYLPD